MVTRFCHVPILLLEVIDSLQVHADGVYVDGTLGGAGHAYEIYKRLGSKGSLIGIDKDNEAIDAAIQRLTPGLILRDDMTSVDTGDKRVLVAKRNYKDMPEVLDMSGIKRVDGILLDLGVSSHQLDDKSRGFSYMEDAPLDMRMDTDSDLSAADIVNEYPKEELIRVIRNYGEERYAPSIASNIVNVRKDHRILSTGELVDIIKDSLPERVKRSKGHPARKTFQALRIECNHELDVLASVLNDMMGRLNDGGRFCIITFHSLEDRIVKNAFKEAMNPCVCPPDFPVCVCGKKPRGDVITKKPIIPSDKEIEDNPRARSAKLRVFEKHYGGVYE